MEITSYIAIFIFTIIWGIFLLSLLSIFSSFFILPAYYGYINIKRKKIRGFISLTLWGILCIFSVCWYFNPNVGEEHYNSFMENYDERCETVEKILNEEIDTGEGWKFELPPEYRHLSCDGTASISAFDDKKMVFFFDHIHYMMGVPDDYNGYAYISDNAKIKDFFRGFKYKKITDNWYFVVVY